MNSVFLRFAIFRLPYRFGDTIENGTLLGKPIQLNLFESFDPVKRVNIKEDTHIIYSFNIIFLYNTIFGIEGVPHCDPFDGSSQRSKKVAGGTGVLRINYFNATEPKINQSK